MCIRDRLSSLNEVGGDPAVLGLPAPVMHDAARDAVVRSTRTLNATATHDTKRGEDARVRIGMLAEMPARWHDSSQRLLEWGRRHAGASGPSPVAAYLFMQTLVGAHPISPDRAVAYMQKAVREAKQETSWLDPNQAYEADVERYVRGAVADPEIINEIESLLDAMTPAWQVAALTQTLMKLVLPGVPDIYQGCELWDLRLVDPDNRTPVDYDLRRDALRRIAAADVDGIMAHMSEGLPKLHLLQQGLRLRHRCAAAFAAGAAYRPLLAGGDAAEHAWGCIRGDGEVVALGVLHPLRLSSRWNDSSVALPAGRWRNVLAGDEVVGGDVRVASLLERFPVALLERVG